MALVYPETRYGSPELIDIGSPQERKRLAPSALKGFFNLARCWDSDTMLRISYLIGIFKALNILHGKTLADRWITLPNRNPIFRDHAPMDYIIRGGIPAMQVVRRLLDARRGGI